MDDVHSSINVFTTARVREMLDLSSENGDADTSSSPDGTRSHPGIMAFVGGNLVQCESTRQPKAELIGYIEGMVMMGDSEQQFWDAQAQSGVVEELDLTRCEGRTPGECSVQEHPRRK